MIARFGFFSKLNSIPSTDFNVMAHLVFSTVLYEFTESHFY